ncbi:MAG TPA: Gfo/Idh/MocA family oxidoreductase [Vicinamibacteria bacterium]|jgi:predicted dehydrogenase|nr:Gfo/Idh/MocA family oxidoreductase [Vicinamibacteria bacterium]
MPEVNVALIGYAFMGRAHSNAYRQVGPFLNPRLKPRLKVLCGRNARAVGEAAARLGWEEAATDWREVVNRKDIHLVDVSTPGDSHAEIAIAAARAGKAVLCEKPLANTLKDAKAMLAAVRRAGVVHMVCHNYRRVPAVQLAQKLIEQGRLGEIRHFRGTYLQDWIVDPSFPLVWRLRKERAGSGALGDLASHAVDLARFLVGEIKEVTAALHTFIKERPLPENPKKRGRVSVDDAAAAVVRFAGGALGTIEASRMAPGRRNYNRFEINGSLGSLVFDLERLNELQVFLRSDAGAVQGFHDVIVTDAAHHPYIRAWWPPGHLIGYEHTFTHTVYDLLEAMADGTVPRPNFEDGVTNQTVLEAMERAARTRRWVTV